MLWPAGLGVVVLVAAMLTRRPERSGARRRCERLRAPGLGSAAGLPEPVRLIGVAVVGWIAAFAFMLVLGAAWVVHDGPSIDRPIYSFAIHDRIPDWTSVMTQLTKIADLPESLVVAAVAAVWLARRWDQRKWVPPLILATTVLVDHLLTIALRGAFERAGPPNSPGGTYPSGGCERAILYFGLIAYLLLRQVGWRRNRTIWAAAVVAALAFNEAYTRIYLTLHWFTDAVSGLIYGALVLAAVILAIRMVIGPAPKRDRGEPAGRPRFAAGR
jgi:hypothetical protein